MSVEMADHMDFDHAGLQEVANAVQNNTTSHDDIATISAQKRKRDLSDQGGSADSTRRSNFKRAAQNISNAGIHNNQATDPGNTAMNNQQVSDAAVEALQEFTSGNQNGGTDHANASSTASAALANIYPTMTIPQPTDVSFATQASDADRNDASFNMGDDSQQNESFMDNSASGGHSSGGRGSGSGSKPAVGSEEWHKVRKDNHKEVERRRRETINEGINELSKIVPGCEKNKGSILQRAVQFITQLKENEAQNIEKWTLEKLLTEQAIAELSNTNDKLKAECERAWREVETWKKACQSAGIEPKKDGGEN